MKAKNFFNCLPLSGAEEIFETLLQNKNIKIERIISQGQISPKDFWYDQEQSEWILLLQGTAKLQFADSDQIIALNAGDYLNISAHRKHRVIWTDPNTTTIWLAIHYQKE